MAQEARELWRALERDSGERILQVTGGLDIGEGIDLNASALDECEVAYEMLDAYDARGRWPVEFETGETVLWQADTGVLLADLAVQTFVSQAVRAGAEVQEGVRVERLEPLDNGVRLHSGHFILEGGTVVVTAGGWVTKLLEPLGLAPDVRVTRESVAYFRLMGQMPPPFVEWGHPTDYALPSGGQEIKAAQHIAGAEVDPDDPGEVDPASLQKVGAWVQRRFPAADPVWHHSHTCLYTNTDDEHFILERKDDIVIGSPCSGHGFKFAPLVGKRLAALAEG
jgi:sarcosine oxidase